MDTDYDVIVAGGGLTGTVAAQAISYYSNQNLAHIKIEKEIHQSNSDNNYHCRFFIGKILDEDNLQINEHDEVLFLHKNDIYGLNIFEEDHLVVDKL